MQTPFCSHIGMAILVAALLGSGCASIPLSQESGMSGEAAGATGERPGKTEGVMAGEDISVEIVSQILELYFENEGIRTKRDAKGHLQLQVTDDSLCFIFGKGQLKPKSAIPLRHLANVLIAYPESRLKITGHTDNVGNEQANLRLSEQRAQAVKGALLLYGVPTRTIADAIGYGEVHPVADNNTEEGRAMNRRVELIIAVDANEAALNQQRREVVSNSK